MIAASDIDDISPGTKEVGAAAASWRKTGESTIANGQERAMAAENWRKHSPTGSPTAPPIAIPAPKDPSPTVNLAPTNPWAKPQEPAPTSLGAPSVALGQGPSPWAKVEPQSTSPLDQDPWQGPTVSPPKPAPPQLKRASVEAASGGFAIPLPKPKEVATNAAVPREPAALPNAAAQAKPPRSLDHPPLPIPKPREAVRSSPPRSPGAPDFDQIFAAQASPIPAATMP